MATIATYGTLSASDHGTQLRKAVIASTIGTAIEWYDFFIYGTAAGLIFGKLYFPNEDPLTATLASFGTYFIGFVGRPIGAAIFDQSQSFFNRRQAAGDRFPRWARLPLAQCRRDHEGGARRYVPNGTRGARHVLRHSWFHRRKCRADVRRPRRCLHRGRDCAPDRRLCAALGVPRAVRGQRAISKLSPRHSVKCDRAFRSDVHRIAIHCRMRARHTGRTPASCSGLTGHHATSPNLRRRASISASTGRPASFPRCWILYVEAARANPKC
jgi:hypothetical protein